MENFNNQIVLDELLSSVTNIDEAVGDNFLNEMSTMFEGDSIDNFFRDRDLEIQNEFNTTNYVEPIFSPLAEIPEVEISSERVFSSHKVFTKNLPLNNSNNTNICAVPSFELLKPLET